MDARGQLLAMRQGIGKGLVRSKLGSAHRALSEPTCPTTGKFQQQWGFTLHAQPTTPVFFQPVSGEDPTYYCGVRGFVGLFNAYGDPNFFKPGGQYRFSIRLRLFYKTQPAGDDRDFVKFDLVIFPPGGNSEILKTWKFNTTTEASIYRDTFIFSAPGAYCFFGLDVNPTPKDSGQPGFVLSSEPYTITPSPPGSKLVYPPFDPGMWILPIPDNLQEVSGISADGSTPVTGAALTAAGIVWSTDTILYQADFYAVRVSMTALFIWRIIGALTVFFSNASLILSNGNNQWHWDFGDGTTSTAFEPTHTYAAPGKYKVTLTGIASGFDPLDDTSGSQSIPFITSTFDQIVTFALKSIFTYISTYPSQVTRNGVKVIEVTFTDQSVGAASWDWDFGDGSPHYIGRNPVHDYTPGGGAITVKLTVGDTVGNFASSSQVLNT
jgi:hypothetical protein